MAQLAPVFADYNSTTPLCLPVQQALSAWGGSVGNMSSAHQFGQRMHRYYDDACDAIREYLSAGAYDVLTCSSATEAHHWVFYSLLNGVTGCPRVIASAIEHPCVLVPLQAYADRGVIDLVLCRVDAGGQLDMGHFQSLLTPNTCLISVMLANNDIGTVFPLAEVCRLAATVGALVHSDVVQAVGKMPLALDAMGVDIATLSAHKCYAPTGCGVVLVKDAALMKPMVLGGAQQQGLRAGTVNVLGLHLFSLGLGYCYDALPHHVDVHGWAMSLCDRYSFLEVVVPVSGGLWNTVAMSVQGYVGHDAMMRLDMLGVAVSTGSACSTGAVDVSASVLALGLPDDVARGVIRLSFGYPTTLAELAFVGEQLGALSPRC